MEKPKIAVIMGDATGIGPEIVAKSLATKEARDLCRPAVVGDARVMRAAVELTKVPLKLTIRKSWDEVSWEPGLMEIFDLGNADPAKFRIGEVSPLAGKSCLEYVEWTIPHVLAGRAKAMVFAPMNKQAMSLGGSRYEAELEHFAQLTKTEAFCEINVLDPLWTSRVTSHVGFREIPSLINPERVLRAITLLHNAMRRSGIEKPKIAVAALNPHAGEKGLFGPEEETLIKPGVDKAAAQGIDAKGPFPADTIFVRARKGEFQGVVTMFHDQGQIAMKLLGFDRGVTVSGGIPIPIATPAHGTAHDIAGKGIADIGALQAAIRVAVRMAIG
ncbi:MAG TPA: 4-hydroxythreonine-4-phosphate dehydrogenase PdxA [Thermodesulfobacteriota bacterium]|nr:4-hydroxythreonine-4-phosphate dehydrogenase PdxA [Thermodesulfobacteriota bacterium]